ncbi:NADPH oxidase regulator NoxR [Fomitopsis betulina]|nr:NADPH oxidase regulator NoxR [Fomitopsis betulina]
MSLKAELEAWAAALKAYDEEDFEKSLELFSSIADSSKILTNMGLIYATLGEHEAAVDQFAAATQLDQYLAVGYFQSGVSNFLLGRYDFALRDFDDALLYMRGNTDINYEQLGLKFKLHSAEVLFNKGLTRIYLGQVDDGLRELQDARKEKATQEHNVIDDAIADRGEGYTVFSIPVGVLYRPSEKKLKNAKTKDYMGKAKLVAAEDANEAFTEFTGIARMKQSMGLTPDAVSPLTRSATTIPPPKTADDDFRVNALQRAKTTINVSVASRAGPASAPADRPPNAFVPTPRSSTPPNNMSLGRANTTAGRAGPGGPTRGLSIRKPGMQPPGPTSAPAQPGVRTTEIYDSYLDGYADEPLPPVPEGRQTPRRAGTTGGRGGRAQAPTSMYSSASSAGGMGARRRPSRRPTMGKRQVSTYEEEEGYESGEWDEGPMELVRIRVKLHYKDDVRGMAFGPEMPWEEFLERVTSKFSRALDGLGMKFKDEDGGKVSLRDEMDYELAIETARENAKGKSEGRLEIWCTDE